jgi:DNA-binding PadR family transcriptional regulator
MADVPITPQINIHLTPAMVNILIALTKGEQNGFAITLQIESLTNEVVKIGPGTLFGSLKRMLEAGLVEQSDERIDPDLDDQRRRYYRITGLGQRSLQMELQRGSSRVVATEANKLLGSSIMGGG